MLTISDKEYEQIRDLMHEKTGVFLKPSKKTLIIGRLRNRLQELKIPSFGDYITLLKGRGGAELDFFINAITTNETFFFRHAKQFNYLFEVVLPEIIERKKGRSSEVTLWSAACSTGEEPYSLAILCKEFFKRHPNFKAKIFASDINGDVIAKAKEGVYSEKSIREASPEIRSRYFKEVKNSRIPNQINYELADEIKRNVEFVRHNLLESFKSDQIDVVFLRNVMIYFDQPMKQKVVSTIERNVANEGYLFLSMSEGLTDCRSSLKLIHLGIYKKINSAHL